MLGYLNTAVQYKVGIFPCSSANHFHFLIPILIPNSLNNKKAKTLMKQTNIFRTSFYLIQITKVLVIIPNIGPGMWVKNYSPNAIQWNCTEGNYIWMALKVDCI